VSLYGLFVIHCSKYSNSCFFSPFFLYSFGGESGKREEREARRGLLPFFFFNSQVRII